MRFIPFAVLLLAACSKEPAAPNLASGSFSGEGRDALCIAAPGPEQRAGFIIYGEGDSNCSARGRIEGKDGSWTLVPSGEGDCRIPLSVAGGRISLGTGGPSCTYYCGPGASFAGKTFDSVASATKRSPTTDFAGEPLC
jgi:hypothetical protein